MKYAKTLICLTLFFAAVFLLTRIDWVVNGLLYGYGLQFNHVWYEQYSIAYFLLWQFTLIVLVVASKSWWLLVFMEAFVLSSTQDLFYFVVWNGGFPVGDWTWMPLYQTLGFYNTAFQICFSVVSMLSAAVVIGVSKKQCKHYYPESDCWRCHVKMVLYVLKQRIKNWF
ncbi:MAG: hypothetical protein WC325_12035, partial [Candidatus Bathyarchaeia archaeon]|jgi:hypothetical protein